MFGSGAIFGEECAENTGEVVARRLAQRRKEVLENLRHDAAAVIEDRTTFAGEGVLDTTTLPRAPSGKPSVHETRRECSERLVALECRESQVVSGAVRQSVNCAKRVPLHERYTQRPECCFGGSMVAVLSAFQGETKGG